MVFRLALFASRAGAQSKDLLLARGGKAFVADSRSLHSG